MSTTDILEAALSALNAFPYSPTPTILWPGIQSSPPDEGIWLVPGLFPNETRDIAWDNDSCVDTRGFFQILVYYRPGQGQIEPSELADALVSYFPKGSGIGPVRVRKRPWQSPAVVEDADRIFIPVTVPYEGLT